jgi:hypothetical protein
MLNGPPSIERAYIPHATENQLDPGNVRGASVFYVSGAINWDRRRLCGSAAGRRPAAPGNARRSAHGQRNGRPNTGRRPSRETGMRSRNRLPCGCDRETRYARRCRRVTPSLDQVWRSDPYSASSSRNLPSLTSIPNIAAAAAHSANFASSRRLRASIPWPMSVISPRNTLISCGRSSIRL